MSVGGGNYDATVDARSVVFARPLVCSVMLQYLVLFGAPSLDTSKTSKPVLANQQKNSTSSDVCVDDMTLNVSQAPLAPFYFGEPQALKLDTPYYPEDSIQAQPVTASPLTTVGLPWENTLVGSQLSPSDMMDGSSVSALNYSLSTGESLMSTPISNVTYTSSSPVSPNIGRKMSTISTAHSSTWSDADQLYWEKVHHFAPIIHQRRYISWSRRPDKSAAKTALQYSMWALAASAAPEYTQIDVDRLYRCATRALKAIENTGGAGGLKQSNDLEQVQAQLLLSMYELKHIDFRQGWITAGCAFRLIQFGWFQDLISGLNTYPASMDWTELEEKRRTFWLAYYLDRIISLRSDSSCTFGEEVSFEPTHGLEEY
ncbi:hypothetical protein FJTKL_03162 [Diaporthe vaccinii]|uniref:Xylanolytic transcriptional activator regulatory domain-containing protein n=1 Tax=Diaporthe vaccinii TaxID=105482 RepID=A0ABR4DWW5_9PEZI